MVKEKPGSTRIYDQDGFRRRAACICVKSESENEVSFFKMSIIFTKIIFKLYLYEFVFSYIIVL